MTQLLFATTNNGKLISAQAAGQAKGYEIVACPLDIDEIQGEDPEKIARDKADKAFALVQKPVIISDDSWAIQCLRGFPGAYMKSVSHWLTAQDFLRLTAHSSDRQVILTQLLIYQDAAQQKVFQAKVNGTLLHEPQGDPQARSWLQVISIEGDNGLSVAGVETAGPTADRTTNNIWRELFTWLEEQPQ